MALPPCEVYTKNSSRGFQHLQSFPVVDAPVNELESKRLVNALRPVVVKPRVRRHLDAFAVAGPVFGRSQKLCANTLLAIALRDEPAFDEPDRNSGVAAVGMGTQSYLQKANQSPGIRFRYENRKRHGRVR